MKATDSTMTTDLVQMAKHGDRSASDEMFHRYYGRVLGFVRRRVGRKLRRDVDSCDIVQDTLMVAVRKLPEFEMRDRTSLMRWLRTIVENQIRDRAHWQNAERRRRTREQEGSDPGLSTIENPGSKSPIDQLARKETKARIEAGLMQLDARYRDLIRARCYERLSWEEIAARFDRPSANAARMMFNNAVAKLGALIHPAD